MLKHITSWRASEASETVLGVDNAKSGICYIYICIYSPLPERPRLSLRTINLIQSGMPVKKCIRGEKSDIVLSNHNYSRRQIKAKWNNEEFGYFNTITKIANAILCSLFMFWL